MPHRTPHRPSLAVALALAATFVFGACSGSGAGGSSRPRAGLDGRTFLSTGVGGRDLVAGTRVRLSFENGRISGSAGCNAMSGPYAIDGDHLVVRQLGMTEMGCDKPRMDQDTWLAGMLDGATIALGGDTLTLAKGATTLTLLDREIADPDRSLLGTRWILDGLISADSTSSVPGGVTAALRFSAGQVDVEAGCNRGGGTVTITATTIAFGPIGLTKMACAGAAMSVEQAVTAVLAGTIPYTIQADRLALGAVGRGLSFRAAP